MSQQLEPLFARLRGILEKHAGGLSVVADTPKRYCLEGRIGPATLQAWRGQAKVQAIPVAWVAMEKSYVSFHLMGLYGNARLRDQMPEGLKARMHGKTCFNFRSPDEALLKQLEKLAASALAAFGGSGFVRKESPERSVAAVKKRAAAAGRTGASSRGRGRADRRGGR